MFIIWPSPTLTKQLQSLCINEVEDAPGSVFRKRMQEACKQLTLNHPQWIAQKELSDSSSSLKCLWLILDNSPPPISALYLVVFPQVSLLPFFHGTKQYFGCGTKTLSLSFWGFVGLSGTSQLQHRNGPYFWPLPNTSVSIRQINWR